MQTVTSEVLDGLWAHAAAPLKAAVIASQSAAYPIGEIDSTLRLIHFWAQVSHESEGGTVLEENLNYTAKRLTEVWPSRFPTELVASPYAHNPKALAIKTYGGRLGNRIGTDDGYDFRGRGLIQTTGRDNFFAVGTILGLDLVSHPEFANEPTHALGVACATWKLRNANGGADDDSVQRVTRSINGGLAGLQSRQAWLAKWRSALSGVSHGAA